MRPLEPSSTLAQTPLRLGENSPTRSPREFLTSTTYALSLSLSKISFFIIIYFLLLTESSSPPQVLTKTTEHRRRVLTGVAENIATWTVWVKKEMSIYHTMNSFNVDVTSKCFIGEGWCPTADIPRIRESLRVATEQTQTMVPSVLNVLRTNMEPPTFNRTNKFTLGFQVIIDAYGVGKYREVNPTPFALISFPFLFAVMFGDVGHGLLMAMAALYIVYNEKKLAKQDLGEIFETFFAGRYIILLMGIFSIYTGLMYNDMFGKALPIFNSAWEFEAGEGNNTYHGVSTGGVYALGIDYVSTGTNMISPERGQRKLTTPSTSHNN